MNFIETPKYNVAELFDRFNLAGRRLCELNLNGCWPDKNPNWDIKSDDNDFELENAVMEEVEYYKEFLARIWTLDEVNYNGEKIFVKFTETYKEFLILKLTPLNIIY